MVVIMDTSTQNNSNQISRQKWTKIKNLLNSPLKLKDVWYVVDARWFDQLRKCCENSRSMPPGVTADQCVSNVGPIDNSSLIETDPHNPCKMRLRRGLVEKNDFVLVPAEVWTTLVELFGIRSPQDVLRREVISCGMFSKQKTVELYPLDLFICMYSNENDVRRITMSRSAWAEELETRIKLLFLMDGTAPWRVFQKIDNDRYELILPAARKCDLDQLSIIPDKPLIVDVMTAGKWHVNNTRPQPQGMKCDEDELNENSNASNNFTDDNGDYGAASVPSKSIFFGPSNPSISSNMSTTPNASQSSVFVSIRESRVVPGLCGLTNLGNTCFMNSALQCLSNVPPLTEYFLSGRFEDEINEKNPLGMHGELARAYANLLQQMWSGNESSVVPRRFKSTVGRYQPMFSGYQQQDSHELMAFLLDGLHEELNRVKNKPYMETKDSDGKPDEVLAAESWRMYKLRNDSIVLDLFHGLLKSTLVCPECEKVSVTFDPFCYLSLPLPEKFDRTVYIVFVPFDYRRPISQHSITLADGARIANVAEALAKNVDVSAENLVFANVEGFQATRVYGPNDSLGKGASSSRMFEKLYAYEVQDVAQSEPYVTFCVYQRRMKSDYSTVYDWSAFGFPQLVRIPKSYLSSSQWKICLIKSLTRFVERTVLEKLLDIVQPKPESSQNSEHLSDSSDNAESPGSDGDDQLLTLVITNPAGTSDLSSTFLLSDDLPDYSGGMLYLAVTWHRSADGRLKDNVYRSLNCTDYTKRVKHYRNLDLSECLELFTTTEKLGEYDAWYCPRCKKHQQATKKFDLWSLPKILVIHLKRFSCSRYFHNKIDVVVSFPARGLNMSRWVINEKQVHVQYDLIGVSNHYGGLGSGHYTACARNCQNNRWYSFDDERVSPIADTSKVVSKAAYILIYMRQDLPLESGDPNVEMETD